MTTAKVGIVFNCRDSESYHVLPVAVSVDCVTNLTKIRSLCNDHVTVLHSAAQAMSESHAPTRPDRREIWIPEPLESGLDCAGTVDKISYQRDCQ